MENIKVSVILPVYKTEPYLRQCLDSIVNQTLKEIEIICINDSSPDNSLSILEEYAARLGADCAFFIRNAPTYAEGIGNVFSPISLSLKGYQLWLVKPDIFVSTRGCFLTNKAAPSGTVTEGYGAAAR